MRGLVKKIEKIENIDLSNIWFHLADFGMQFEIEMDYLKSSLILTNKNTDMDKAKSLLDAILKHINPQTKDAFTELVEQYAKQNKNSKSDDIVIRTNTSKTMMGKQRGRTGLSPKQRS